MPNLGEIISPRVINRKGTRKYIWSACEDCGKQRWVQLKKGNQPQSQFCHTCGCKRRQHCFLSGERNINWVGGRIKRGRDYMAVQVHPDNFFYPMANSYGYVLEHRLVVAKALGRCLHRWEIVHHKHDKYPAGSIEDKQDNRYPENLQLVSDDRHKQITILENRIRVLEKEIERQAKRITLLEAENILSLGTSHKAVSLESIK